MAVFFTPTTPKKPEPLPREFHNLRGHCRRKQYILFISYDCKKYINKYYTMLYIFTVAILEIPKSLNPLQFK